MFSLEKIPKRKCGAEVILGGVLGGAGLLGSALATSSATRTQEQQNALNRSYNSAESQKAREWSTNERLAAQAYNTSEREAAQRYQTASVPQNIASSISALRASGVNANVIGSSAINSGATVSSGQTAPIGSGGQASFGTGVNPQVMQIPQLISSGAEMVNALSKNKETRANLPLVDANVRLALEKMYGQQKANELQDLYVKFERSNLPTKLKKSMEEYVSLVLQNGNAVKQGKLFDKQSDLLEAEKNVQNQIEKLRGAEAIQAQFYADHVADIYKADMSLKGAQTREANAQAVQAGSQAEQIQFFTKLYKEPSVREALSNQIQRAADNALKDGSIKEEQANLIRWQSAQLEKATSNYEIMMWSNIINQTVNTFANAVGEFTKFGLVKQFLQPRGSFDPNAGRGFTINQDNGLLFRNGM